MCVDTLWDTIRLIWDFYRYRIKEFDTCTKESTVFPETSTLIHFLKLYPLLGPNRSTRGVLLVLGTFVISLRLLHQSHCGTLFLGRFEKTKTSVSVPVTRLLTGVGRPRPFRPLSERSSLGPDVVEAQSGPSRQSPKS